MKKSIICTMLILCLLLVSCGSSSTAQGTASGKANPSTETTYWKMGMTATAAPVEVSEQFPNGLRHPFYQYMEFIDDEMNKETDGKYRVEYYMGAQLGNEGEVLENIMNGTYKAGIIATSYLGHYVDNFNALDFPFLYDDYDHIFRVFGSDYVAEMMSQVEEESNCVSLSMGIVGALHLSNNKRPIKTLNDVKGLKIRVADSLVHLRTIESMGAQAMPANWAEVYTGFQQGTFDGTNSLAWGYYSAKLYEVQKYLTECYMIYATESFIMNKDYFYGLPAEDQAAIRKASKQAEARHLDDYIAQDVFAFEELKKNGMEIVYANEFDRQPFVDAVKPYIEENRGKYGELFDVIDSLRES